MSGANWWQDPDASWWAKVSRAREHLDVIGSEIDSFLRSGAYEIVSEPGERATETTYRLRVHSAVPVRISTIVGDVLHNLRSALDCAAFVVAERYVGQDLTPAQQRATEFPICFTLEDVDSFFRQRGRRMLYGPRERRAIRDAQPGSRYDEAARLGVTNLRPRSYEVEHDPLWVLNRLSNIDKHRRLHMTVFFPELVYWGSNGESRARWEWGSPPFEDGSVIGRIMDDPEHPDTSRKLYDDMRLRLTDPPAATLNDVASLLSSIHQTVSGWTLPRVLNPYWIDDDGNLVGGLGGMPGTLGSDRSVQGEPEGK